VAGQRGADLKTVAPRSAGILFSRWFSSILISYFLFILLPLLRIISILKMSQKDDLAYGGYYQGERGSGDGSRGLGDTFKKLRDTYKSHSSSSGQASQTYNPSGYQGVSFTGSQRLIYSLTLSLTAELPYPKRAPAIRTKSTEPKYKRTATKSQLPWQPTEGR
jgi:hypothetical protein